MTGTPRHAATPADRAPHDTGRVSVDPHDPSDEVQAFLAERHLASLRR